MTTRESRPSVVLSSTDFVILILIAIYFQLSPLRSVSIDVVYSSIIVSLFYFLLRAYRNGSPVVIDLNKTTPFVYQKKKRSYSVSEMKQRKPSDANSNSHLIVVKPRPALQNYVRSSTPDVSSAQSPILNKEENKGFVEVTRVLSKEELEVLPTDAQHGRVVWLKGDYGCIQAIESLLPVHEILFRRSDCHQENGEMPVVHTGDRVLFRVQLKDNRLYAVDVQRMGKRTLSSPDFSRLVLRRSSPVEISSLQLSLLC
ncbi:hypothetical protein WA588_001769 [Blastocystis sp. NMH]